MFVFKRSWYHTDLWLLRKRIISFFANSYFWNLCWTCFYWSPNGNWIFISTENPAFLWFPLSVLSFLPHSRLLFHVQQSATAPNKAIPCTSPPICHPSKNKYTRTIFLYRVWDSFHKRMVLEHYCGTNCSQSQISSAPHIIYKDQYLVYSLYILKMHI